MEIPSINEDQEPLWTREYYEDRSEILKLYNTITKEISDELNVKLKQLGSECIGKAVLEILLLLEQGLGS